jgi:hypothetical protein
VPKGFLDLAVCGREGGPKCFADFDGALTHLLLVLCREFIIPTASVLLGIVVIVIVVVKVVVV